MDQTRISRSTVVALLVGIFTLGMVASARAAELIMFEEQGCPWCERWRREIGVAYPNTLDGKRAPLRRIDISQSRASGIELASPVVVSPTFVLADNGREIGRIIGYPGADFFWSLLAELLVNLDRSPRGEHRSKLNLMPYAGAFSNLIIESLQQLNRTRL